MPIYEYNCTNCGATFEFFARTLKDKPLACPQCQSDSLQKAFSTFQARQGGTSGCACAHECPHAHGPGCGCGCH